jgi:hypothetical protein
MGQQRQLDEIKYGFEYGTQEHWNRNGICRARPRVDAAFFRSGLERAQVLNNRSNLINFRDIPMGKKLHTNDVA